MTGNGADMQLSDTQRTTLEAEVAALIDLLMANYAIGDSDEPVLAASSIDGYRRQLERLGEVAGQSGFTILQLGCAQLAHQLQGLEPADSPASATVDEPLRDLLETWPTLVMGCLDAPDETAETLIGLLQEPGWPTPATAEELQRITASAVADPPQEPAPRPDPELEITPPDISPTLDTPAEVTDAEVSEVSEVSELEPTSASEQEHSVDSSLGIVSEVSDTTESPTTTKSDIAPSTLSEWLAACPDPGTNPAAFTDWLGAVANAAATENQFGLHDIALLLQEQVQAMEPPLSPEAQQALVEWPPLVGRFVDEAGSPAAAEALINHLLKPVWPQPIADDDTVVLLEMLTPPPTDGESPDSAVESVAESESPLHEPVQDPIPQDAGDVKPAQAEPIPEPPESEPREPEAWPAPLPEEHVAEVQATPEPAPEPPIETPIIASIAVEQPSEAPVAADAAETEPTTEFTAESASSPSEPVISEDLLEILMAELAEITENADQAVNIARDHASADARRQALEGLGEEIGRLQMAAESIGLDGLGQYCTIVQTNVLSLAERAQPLGAAESELLAGWLEPTLAYLNNPLDPDTATTLVDLLTRNEWPQALDAGAASVLVDSLLNPSPTLADFGEIEERPREALPEAVSLQLPGDTNPELLDSLLQELPNQVAEFSSLIQRLYNREGDLGMLETAQRIAHTLKGAGNTVGIAGVANLTHHTEDILIALSKEHTLPNRALSKTLMDVADCLEAMCEALTGMGSAPAHARQVLQDVLDWANRIDSEGVPATDAVPVTPMARSVPVDTEAAASTETDTAATTAATEEAARQSSMIRVPAELIDELLRLVGESILIAGQIEEQVRGVMTQTRQVRTQHQNMRQLVAELEQLVDVQGVGMPTYALSSDSDFDPLEMDQYNELHTLTRRLTEAAADAQALDENLGGNFAMLDKLLIEQAQTHRDNQETVLRSRMLPIRTIVPRLQRVVRQTCRLTDKEVDLQVKGEDTLIESVVLNEIIDPLMHLLRNAIDHGIETPEQRLSGNKPESGHIQLSFSREGNSILVRCRDDGRGLDLEAIRRNAEQRGLVAPGTPFSDEELSRLILQPGFSTRGQATQVSGRGIGLDVVYSQILKLKGALSLNTEPGQGTTFELRLPVTLIATHALLVQQGTQVFAVAERGVDQILHSSSGELITTDAGDSYRIGTATLELNRLENLLHLQPSVIPIASRPLLQIRDETDTLRTVMVDAVLGTRDLVVKNMGRLAPRVHGVLGATLLGDGSVIPVLDLPELLRSPQHEPAASSSEVAALQPRSILIVDDSLSVRRAMQQLIGDAGFEARVARDGLDAIAQLNESVPDLMVVDLEMPRMNGLELTQHVRSQDPTRDVPIIMVTSRSTSKHREEAEKMGVNSYMTKPVADQELLELINQLIAS